MVAAAGVRVNDAWLRLETALSNLQSITQEMDRVVIKWYTGRGGPVSRNFARRGRPTKWRRLTSAYKKKKRRAGKGGRADLKLSGRLKKEALNPKNYKLNLITDGATVTWLTNLPYAFAHEFGTKTLPIRSYLRFVSLSDLKILQKRQVKVWEKEIRKARKAGAITEITGFEFF